MGEFREIPSLNIWKDGEWAKCEQFWLEERLVYYSEKYDETIIVPEGFETDLASIPRPARLLIPKNDSHRAPAIVHDWLCRTARSHDDRKKADHIFLEAMKDVDHAMKPNPFMCTVYSIRRRTMFTFVRLAGMARSYPE